MEQYLVNTKKLPCAVKAIIATNGSQVPIYIIGYDTINANTLYFRSRFLITGEEEITLNCPQSPRTLKIVIWSEDDLPYNVSSITLVPLNVIKSSDPIVKWIEYFSRICGRLRPGNYVGDNVPFTVQLKRNIYTDDGQVHPTPARIHTELPIIQVSKAKFDQNTVPERVIILLHEVAHNYINNDQDNEVESDQNALNIYNELGYPKIEAVNAFGDIMADTDNNYQRMLNLVNM
jgi:hypothetical protein